MTDWRITIPYKHRDEPLSATAGFARHLPTDDDRKVARQIVFGALERGVRTAGDFLDELEALEPHERKAMLDQARAECGLEPTADVDARERARAPLALRPAPATPATRLVRRQDGSFFEEPLNPARWAYGPSGQLVNLNTAEADAARQRAVEDSTRAQQQARQADRDRDAAAARQREQHKREQLRTELPDHLKETAA